MSYMASGGMDGKGVLKKVLSAGGYFLVPGWTYASNHLDGIMNRSMEEKVKFGVALLIGIVMMILLWTGWGLYMKAKNSGFDGSVQILRGPNVWGGAPGAAGSKTIKLSDPYHDAGYGAVDNRSKTVDTFYSGHMPGPEFVEQPNYVLGQEDMQRTALSKWNRLVAPQIAQGVSGAALNPSWASYWAAYKADNADDLDVSMYTFGDEGGDAAGDTVNWSGMAVSKPQNKKLMSALR